MTSRFFKKLTNIAGTIRHWRHTTGKTQTGEREKSCTKPHRRKMPRKDKLGSPSMLDDYENLESELLPDDPDRSPFIRIDNSREVLAGRRP